ncbi:MAG: hypothetical protein JNM94_16490 [Phycisphaerae bacterium]|nr:hypothetical protein [Phycisphaerae bacterium]
MRFIVLVSCLAPLLSSVADAATFVGPIPYLSVADSPLDVGDPTFILETFEDDLFNVAGVTSNLDSNAVIGPGGLTDSVDADDGVIDGNGSNGHSFFSGSGSGGVTFVFDAAILGSLPTSVGIVWTDGAGTTLLEAFGPGDVLLGSIGPSAIADGSFFGTTVDDHFFGVTDEGGIAKIRISNSSGGIEVDHFQFAFGGKCPTTPDLDGDGSVNAADLAILLGDWGPCAAEGCCESDFDGDGSVGPADLGILLGAWST